MAALTKLARCIDWDRPTVSVSAGVTIDTANQAVPLGPDTLVHSSIALMQQKPHVIAAHHLEGFDTALRLTDSATRLRYGRHCDPVGGTKRRHGR